MKLIAEHGPELVYIPSGGTIIPANKAKDILRGQKPLDVQLMNAAQDQTPPRAKARPEPNVLSPVGGTTSDSGQSCSDSQDCRAAVGTDSETGRLAEHRSSPKALVLADPSLAFAADILDDLENTRNANANRLRSLTDPELFGLDESHPDVARLSAMVQALEGLYHDAELELKRKMRKHPLGPWVKSQPGIGEKQAARLLASIGDPYWNTLHGRPRTVSELWAYCGLHTLPAGGDQRSPDAQRQPVAARRVKGQRANWSSNAKTRAWLCIESCLKLNGGVDKNGKQRALSPYRVVIDERRARTAITHPEWTPGHSLNDAMRIASKALLRDLWREAKRIHEEQS